MTSVFLFATLKWHTLIWRSRHFFSSLKLRLLTTLLLLSVEIKLIASTLLLGSWVPEPLWLSSSISNCYQPLRIPSHTSPFLFIPVSRISLWKLKHQSWKPTSDTKGKPGSTTSSQRWEERTSGLHSRASPSQGPWADKVTAHLQNFSSLHRHTQGSESRGDRAVPTLCQCTKVSSQDIATIYTSPLN